jgi:hypothetical protein
MSSTLTVFEPQFPETMSSSESPFKSDLRE